MKSVRFPASERVNWSDGYGGHWVVPNDAGDRWIYKNINGDGIQDGLLGCNNERRYVGSCVDHFALMGEVFALRNAGGEVEKLTDFIKETMRHYPLLTMTRVRHHLDGGDEVIQQYDGNGKVGSKAHIVGLEGWIDVVLSNRGCLALTGKGADELRELAHYFIRGPLLFWSTNFGAIDGEERGVVFGAGAGWEALNCISTYAPHRSLAMRTVKPKLNEA